VLVSWSLLIRVRVTSLGVCSVENLRTAKTFSKTAYRKRKTFKNDLNFSGMYTLLNGRIKP
jgi:hypothetical protein